MSRAKVMEISAESEERFEDAVQQALLGPARRLRIYSEQWIKEQKVDVEHHQIVCYRVDMKVMFVLRE